MPVPYRPDPRHPDLGDGFADPVAPARFPRHVLRFRNDRWAARVGLADLDDAQWIGHFGRFEPLPGNLPEPLALRYHGHQFRVYNPDIGDGRGFLFAQLRDDRDRLLDLGTKGSGQTPYSRSGDGRLTLKGGVRELLATALLEALGVYTSKSFSLIETGEQLERGDEPSPTRASVLVRLSHSHIRFGSFQRLLYEGDTARIERLVAHCCRHYLPGATDAASLLDAVVANTARLTATWMAAGFVHGVLNTDNMTVTGESFDYGPWRFLPTYQPGFTAAYFDHGGLYAYGRQPVTARWNLARLAECLLDLAPEADLVAALERFPTRFEAALAQRTRERLGIESEGPEADLMLATAVYRFLSDSQAGFERFFFDWHGGPAAAERAARSPQADRYGPAFEPLRALLLAARPMAFDAAHFDGPGPETLLIDEVEALWAAIAEHDDWQPLYDKLARIERQRQALALDPLMPALPLPPAG